MPHHCSPARQSKPGWFRRSHRSRGRIALLARLGGTEGRREGLRHIRATPRRRAACAPPRSPLPLASSAATWDRPAGPPSRVCWTDCHGDAVRSVSSLRVLLDRQLVDLGAQHIAPVAAFKLTAVALVFRLDHHPRFPELVNRISYPHTGIVDGGDAFAAGGEQLLEEEPGALGQREGRRLCRLDRVPRAAHGSIPMASIM